MAKKFRTIRPDGTLTNPEGPTLTISRAALRIVGGEGPYRIKLRGGLPGPERTRADCLVFLRKRLHTSKFGEVYTVLDPAGDVVYGVRVVEVEGAPVVDLGCAPGIEVIHAFVFAHFDVKKYGLHSLGRWYCRNIDGTSTVSRHGYQGHDASGRAWYGAAEDFGARSMTQLYDIARYIIDQTEAGRFDASTVIWDDNIWTSGEGTHSYGGDRHYHVHVDVSSGGACDP